MKLELDVITTPIFENKFYRFVFTNEILIFDRHEKSFKQIPKPSSSNCYLVGSVNTGFYIFNIKNQKLNENFKLSAKAHNDFLLKLIQKYLGGGGNIIPTTIKNIKLHVVDMYSFRSAIQTDEMEHYLQKLNKKFEHKHLKIEASEGFGNYVYIYFFIENKLVYKKRLDFNGTSVTTNIYIDRNTAYFFTAVSYLLASFCYYKSGYDTPNMYNLYVETVEETTNNFNSFLVFYGLLKGNILDSELRDEFKGIAVYDDLKAKYSQIEDEMIENNYSFDGVEIEMEFAFDKQHLSLLNRILSRIDNHIK